MPTTFSTGTNLGIDISDDLGGMRPGYRIALNYDVFLPWEVYLSSGIAFSRSGGQVIGGSGLRTKKGRDLYSLEVPLLLKKEVFKSFYLAAGVKNWFLIGVQDFGYSPIDLQPYPFPENDLNEYLLLASLSASIEIAEVLSLNLSLDFGLSELANYTAPNNQQYASKYNYFVLALGLEYRFVKF